MKTIRVILASLLFVLMSDATRAEDIDIYSGLSGLGGNPNVLIILDNAANFDASASACSYTDSATAPTLSGKTGGIEQCALNNVLSTLGTNADGSAKVNVGIMIYNANGFNTQFSGCQSGGLGGCLMVPLTPMDAAGKAAIMAQIKSWSVTGASSMKSNNEADASAMQEAWAYYAGQTGMSGRTYTSPAAAGCQKNFVIFISNAFNNSGTPGDASQAPGTKLTATVDANSALTSAQKTAFKTTISLPSRAYGTSSFSCGTYTMPTHNDGSGLYADEWARYMNGTDLSSGESPATKNIITYAIGVLDPACKPDWPALLTSMALNGGGKYFATSSYSDVAQAILKILNEVQAVNSVFSSSSLPVSVNAQGTYLNQIYMGMFRPDANGNPRWMGNLKQYQFIYDAATNGLQLGDSLGLSAISSAGTGFISPNAVSYWTCGGASTDPNKRACSPVADPSNGFWVNDSTKTNSAGKAFDLPDGELVEKGGAAQIMRLANLTDDYTTTAGTATNPRKLYTYCPSGASCNAALTDSSNALATTNANIVATQFGGASSLPVSIHRTGTTALVSTGATPHGYSDGASVAISNAAQNEYNVTQAISFANPYSANTFTITGLGDYPTTPNTGTYTAALHNSTTKTITSVALSTSTTANANGCASGAIPNINCNKVTITVPSHGYSTNDLINITGVMTSLSPNPYSGSFTITKIDNDTFSYNVPVTPVSPSVNAYSAQLPAPAAKAITNIQKVTGNCTVTATAHGYSNGDSVTISGNSAWNGTYTVASAAANTFQIALNCNSTGTGGSAIKNNPVISIAAGNISRASATATTATATGITASAFSNGNTINLTKASGAGTSETEYAPVSGSRSVTITCSGTCTSFTFPITTNTGTATTLTTSSPTAALAGTPVTVLPSKITRTGGTFAAGTADADGNPLIATVTGVANTFTTGQFIDISVSGTAVGTESAYLSPAAGWQITCPVACSTAFTFGPVTLSPATPATIANNAANITAYSGATPPVKDPLINWVRGADNFGDEASLCPPGTAAGTGNCPATAVTVRPSVHGDVLHSRPVVINYSGTTGVVVFYGANDGVFRAINGNQTNPVGSTLPVPGSELWGFVPTEFFSKLDRQRTNSPMLALSTTPSGIVPTPLKKDYFADGSTGIYQSLNADGTTNTAYIYMAMRRGGRFIYALDVSTPTNPQFLWKIDPTGITTPSGYTAVSGFAELGQTWSAPKVAMVEGYANPVLIFGAGYDTAEDSEPPTTNAMGRGIFILDAITGGLVWSAGPTGSTACSSGTTPPCHRTVSGMDYSIPADITLVDRDGNGKIDRLYVVDVGGNVWRVDLQPISAVAPATTASVNTPDVWQVTKLAALGCTAGVCAVGPPRTTPRKFFYPADVVPTSGYDGVMVGQGDREHPLSTDASVSIRNRLFMLRDLNTGNNGCAAAAPTTAGAFTPGDSYTILTVGTTDFTLIGAASNTVGLSFTATGAGSGTGVATTGTPIAAGSFIPGVCYTIQKIGTTNFTLIGAASNTVGLVFTATGAGSGTGYATAQAAAIVRNKLVDETTSTVFTAGSFTAGVSYRIVTIGTTNFTLIGASSNTVGLSFTATGPGSGTGTATTGTPTTAGSFLPGVSYTILTIGTTNFTSIGAQANPTVGSVFIATGPGSGTGTAMQNSNYSTKLPSADGTVPNMGYYVRLVNNGEKAVNAPLTVAGYTYFGTNQPTAPDPNTCSTNLGIARGYRLSPLDATYTSAAFSGGGMPPSPVAGLVSITVNGVAMLVPFIIGGGGDPTCVGADCSSALGGGKPTISVPTSRSRTYWYREMD